ncbi:MAG: response regulator transcription factor [Sphingobacteriales bacterium]|nr:MAG: response regulator transcription factor [Sphingobacteriales bacterium]
MLTSPIKLLIVDDHSMIRKGIRLTIETTFGIKDIAEENSCATLLSHLRKNPVTHLILDLLVDDGNSLEVLPSVRSMYPNVRILIFSMQPPEVYAIALKQYGLHEYLHKEATEEDTIHILQKFFFGETPVSSSAGTENKEGKTNPFSTLSARELEVLHYLLNGIGTKQISETLNLQMSTISTMKARIFEKTAVQNIKELIDLALLYNISS